MDKKRSFIKQFWKEKKMVGAMAPSSRFLAQKMLENIDFSNANIIVEMGPGTGVFTQRILDKMKPDAKLIVFELNDTFYKALLQKIKDPRIILIHDSAEKIQTYLEKYELPHADIVLSSLPLSNIPSNIRNNILKASYDALSITGKYIQFQYSLQSKKNISKYFPKMDIKFTPLNFPPAFIYICKK